MCYLFCWVYFNLDTCLNLPWSFLTIFLKGRRQFGGGLWEGETEPVLARGRLATLCEARVLFGAGRTLTGRSWCSPVEHQQPPRTPAAPRPLCDRAGLRQKQNQPIIMSKHRQNMTIAKTTKHQALRSPASMKDCCLAHYSVSLPSLERRLLRRPAITHPCFLTVCNPKQGPASLSPPPSLPRRLKSHKPSLTLPDWDPPASQGVCSLWPGLWGKPAHSITDVLLSVSDAGHWPPLNCSTGAWCFLMIGFRFKWGLPGCLL